MRPSFTVVNSVIQTSYCATYGELSACLSSVAIANKIRWNFSAVSRAMDSYLHFLLPYHFETRWTILFITHYYLWVAAKDTVCCDWLAALFYSAEKNI